MTPTDIQRKLRYLEDRVDRGDAYLAKLANERKDAEYLKWWPLWEGLTDEYYALLHLAESMGLVEADGEATAGNAALARAVADLDEAPQQVQIPLLD